MHLHDYLRLPFRQSVLREYLEISPQTLKHLMANEPVQTAVIKRIMRKLNPPDDQIQLALNKLALPKPKRQPPVIYPVTLPRLTVPRVVVPLVPAPAYYVSSAHAPGHQLIVTILPASTARDHRVNHSLYAGEWQAYPPYPRQSLSNGHLAAFCRSWNYHLPKSFVFVFLNCPVHPTREARFAPYLMAILMVAAIAPDRLNFVIDQQCGENQSNDLLQELDRLSKFLQLTQHQPLITRLVDPAEQLSLQAANIMALAAARLPQALWHHALIDPVFEPQINTSALVQAFRHPVSD